MYKLIKTRYDYNVKMYYMTTFTTYNKIYKNKT